MAGIIDDLRELDEKLKNQETNLYIVAGVLGGVDLILIAWLIVLCFLVVQIKDRLREAEQQKRVNEEINAQKMTAYTGEEMHRKLLATSIPAVPLSAAGPARGGPDSEYAFNAPFVENRVLGQGYGQPLGSRAGSQLGGPSRLHRY